jgi:glyoxylase-like metal-dependent hydrolase (beta-lactamase superfamily II)
VIDEKTSHAALVDPGDEADLLSQFVEEAGAEVQFILATHCHLDHVSAAAEMKKRLNVDFLACEKDQFLLDTMTETCRLYGLEPAEAPVIDRVLDHGDELNLGKSTLQFLGAPGHSPGSLLIQAGEEDVIVGDVLFAGSIGRTDLPGGSMETLRDSIMKVLVPLGDAMRVHPGHGPATTIGWEKTSNMFLLEWS